MIVCVPDGTGTLVLSCNWGVLAVFCVIVMVCLSPLGFTKITVYCCPSTPFGIVRASLEGVVEATFPSIIIELVYTDKENFLLGHSEGSPLPRMGIFPPSVENCRVVSVMPELTLKTRELL